MPRGTLKKEKRTRTGPKRALTPFMYFNKANRCKVLEKNPGIAFGDIAKELGTMWKAMSEEDKAPYMKEAGEDKDRYAREVKGLEKPKNTSDSEDDVEKSSEVDPY
jgi:hypothetical protein